MQSLEETEATLDSMVGETCHVTFSTMSGWISGQLTVSARQWRKELRAQGKGKAYNLKAGTAARLWFSSDRVKAIGIRNTRILIDSSQQ